MKIELRAAEGGEDSKLFVRDLADAYIRYLDGRHWKHTVEVMDGSITISAKDIPEFINEAGTHRLQRVPPTEKRGRVHTSSVTVSVLMAAQVRVNCPYAKRTDEDFEIRPFSGTGAGGQHRNRKMCSIVMTHIPTCIQQVAVGRSKTTNIDEARQRLEALLDAASASQAHSDMNASRKSQIGLGMRGDKRRTYRFQDDSVVDHVTGRKTTCRKIMRGHIADLWPQ